MRKFKNLKSYIFDFSRFLEKKTKNAKTYITYFFQPWNTPRSYS